MILNRLDYVWHLNNKNPHELVKSLHALMLTDSAIVSVVVEDGQLLETHADSLSISPIDFHLLLQPDSMNREFTKVFRERYLFMGGSMSNHSNCYRGIVIDLYHLHKQFIDSGVIRDLSGYSQSKATMHLSSRYCHGGQTVSVIRKCTGGWPFQ